MKKSLGKLVALVLFAVALTGMAVAQDDAYVFLANIPFNFYAGGQLLPAGEYKIWVNLEDRVVTVGQKATGSRHMLLGLPDDSSRDDRTVLTFRLAEGDVYDLREVQGPDLGVSFRASGSKHAMKAQSQKPESVQIVAEAR
jgi:hypothetical protein